MNNRGAGLKDHGLDAVRFISLGAGRLLMLGHFQQSLHGQKNQGTTKFKIIQLFGYNIALQMYKNAIFLNAALGHRSARYEETKKRTKMPSSSAGVLGTVGMAALIASLRHSGFASNKNRMLRVYKEANKEK